MEAASPCLGIQGTFAGQNEISQLAGDWNKAHGIPPPSGEHLRCKHEVRGQNADSLSGMQ